MLGLPGDFTPPSRFVRAVAFSQSVLPSKTGNGAVLEAFHILNQFDIPKGAACEHEKDAHGNILANYTQWTSAADLKAKQYYFRTYENSQIRMMDLMKMNLGAKDIVTMSIKGDEVIKPPRGGAPRRPRRPYAVSKLNQRFFECYFVQVCLCCGEE